MAQKILVALLSVLFSGGPLAQTIKPVNFAGQPIEIRPEGYVVLVPHNANEGELIGLAQLPVEADISRQMANIGRGLFGRQFLMPTQINATLSKVFWNTTAKVVDAKGQRYGIFYFAHVSNNILNVGIGAVKAGDDAHTREVIFQASDYLKQMMLGSQLPAKNQAPTSITPTVAQNVTEKRLNPATDPNAKPLHPNIQSTVEGVYFRYRGDNLVYPLVLFKDGNYWNIDDAPLEYTDFDVEKRGRSAEWGTWRKQGARYYLTDQTGASNDYLLGTNFYQSHGAKQSGDFLNKRYKKVVFTAGLGPDGVSTFSSSRYAFSPNGRFTTENVIGASGPSVAAGSDQTKSGTYTVQGHTIVLTYGDGRLIRRFFGFSSGGNPSKEDRELVFIGGNPFVAD